MKFTEILRELSVPYQTDGKYTRAGWVQFKCPFCGTGSDPNKPYMGFNIKFAYCNCWRCGNRRTVEVLVALSGMSASRCRQLLQDLDHSRARREIVPRGTLKLPSHAGPLAKAHKKYLRGRQFDPKELERLWGLQGTGYRSSHPWRIVIPIVLAGETVSWTSRAIGSTDLRYVSAKPEEEAVNHKHLIYGADYCRHAIIVTEGPANVWRIGPGAGATLGVNVSPEQVLLLSKYAIRAVCFDNEPAAQRRAQKLCGMLEVFPGETYNVELDAKDPAEASKQQIKWLRKHFLE